MGYHDPGSHFDNHSAYTEEIAIHPFQEDLVQFVFKVNVARERSPNW